MCIYTHTINSWIQEYNLYILLEEFRACLGHSVIEIVGFIVWMRSSTKNDIWASSNWKLMKGKYCCLQIMRLLNFLTSKDVLYFILFQAFYIDNMIWIETNSDSLMCSWQGQCFDNLYASIDTLNKGMLSPNFINGIITSKYFKIISKLYCIINISFFFFSIYILHIPQQWSKKVPWTKIKWFATHWL